MSKDPKPVTLVLPEDMQAQFAPASDFAMGILDRATADKTPPLVSMIGTVLALIAFGKVYKYGAADALRLVDQLLGKTPGTPGAWLTRPLCELVMAPISAQPKPPPKFAPGDRVRVARLLDDMTDRALLGRAGQIMTVDDIVLQGHRLQVNYYLTDASYMHEEELDPA